MRGGHGGKDGDCKGASKARGRFVMVLSFWLRWAEPDVPSGLPWDWASPWAACATADP